MKQSQGIRRGKISSLRDIAGSTWFAPAAMSLVFVVVLAGLLWLVDTQTLHASRNNLTSSIGTAQESIRLRLHATRDHLAALADDMARETITRELFSERMAHYMREHPELVSAMYVDADGKALWAVPAQWEEKVLGRPLACPRSLEVCREAKRTHNSVYSDVHMSLQNEPAFDLCVPIHDRQTYLGAIVGIYSCERLLRNMISREIVHDHRVSLIDAQGNIICALPAVTRIDERLFHTASLDPPGQGLSLRLDRYGSGFWGLEMLLLVVLCVGLAFGMSWGMWSLKRQIARRVEAQQQLREVNEGLAVRVRERTADLEAVNQRLQSEMAERRRAEKESRQHQEELAHVARVSTMGEMATGLAHELNQPLGAIASFAEGGLRVLDADNANPEPLRTALTEISEQARRAGRIIHRLRSFVATGEPKKERIHLKPLTEELIDLVMTDIHQEQIDLRLDLPESLPMVLVDGIQTQQVLLNLLRNAIESLQQVDTGPRRITVTAMTSNNGTVTVSVSDSGRGCGPESMARMFNPFFTTKKSGIGMGLSISRSIVEAHGGRIWAVSNPSGGLTVYFTILTVAGDHDAPTQKA